MNLQPNLPNDMMMGQVAQMSNSSYNGQAQNVQASSDRRNHPDSEKVRGFVQKKIFDFLVARGQQQSSELSNKRVADFTRLVDRALFNSAATLDDYMNVDTLEVRLLTYLKDMRNNQKMLVHHQRQMNSGVGNQQQVNSGFGNQSVLQNQQFVHHGNSSGNVSTMIPTPGGFLPLTGGMGSASSFSNGYQQPTSVFPTTSGSNNMVSSMGGGERILSQMMPTPGFVNTNNTESYRSLESSNGGVVPTVESMMVSQPLQQKQHISGQNRRMLHNVGSHIGGGIRNGTFSGGLGMMTNYSQSVNGAGSFENQLPMSQVLHHDGYGSGNADFSGSGTGNVYASLNAPALMTNNQANQSEFINAQQDVHVKPLIEQSVKINSQSPQSLTENVVQSHQQFLQQPNQISQPKLRIQPNQLIQQNQQIQQNQSLPSGESQMHKKQVRWLLFLRHARSCSAAESCAEKHCIIVQNLYRHIETCTLTQCPYPRCNGTRSLLNHYKICKRSDCPVCVPVRDYMKKQHMCKESKTNDPSVDGSFNTYNTMDASGRLMNQSVVDIEDVNPPAKRTKIEQPLQSTMPEHETSAQPLPAFRDSCTLQDVQYLEHRPDETFRSVKSNVTVVKLETPAQGVPLVEVKKDMNDTSVRLSDGVFSTPSGVAGFPKDESFNTGKELVQTKPESVTLPAENTATTKSGKPEIKGVSLTELFTPDQVREHITGLKQWVGQSKAKAEKNQAMEHSMSENSCQLCAVEKLNFEPPPIYCTPCGVRIKRNAMYYTIGVGESRQYFCIPCYNETRGETISIDGTPCPKAKLEKKRNDQETEEGWVQCDKCEAWQHQICALFNSRRNEGGQAEFTCPNCYIAEVERGERMPLPQSAVLGAKDLPRTILSDHLEQRLFKQLKQERIDRARVQGKTYDEVPGAEYLVIRVVSSVDKKLEVKPRFLEIFQEVNYPTEYAYKSKVVLLFQKIEGVEVCLFAMYVQEFGADCQQPNHRRVYLSYLDSVKYFRPEIKAVTGEALRTFVYHEILIGYLEYCKKRGFTSCYIWACPPLKGEDYILYCHPEIQKTPKSDKLREWYLSMLKKASKEKVVVELTNLYDHFFVSGAGECKAKVTAARLPYFDGDYWPGAAEDIIYKLRQEEDGGKLHKKGTTKKTFTKRALRASGQIDLSGNASKDLMLMHKLGETISPMKEDFIMVHLQHSCSHCCILMTSGNCWFCSQCKSFKLCDKCHEEEQKLEERDRHPINQRGMHMLYPVEVTGVPADTQDTDEILESEFFDTRQAFLGLCQGNHYQYDTLRRAKHSSMMVLYHLHNPTAPAFVTTCYVCHLDIETGQGWRCEICPDYDVCNACYEKDRGVDHPHKLTNHPSIADRDAQNKEARQQRVIQLRKMLDLLVHASQCRVPECQYPNCRKVKRLFRHGMYCKIRSAGGCVLCRRMWHLLQLHARSCKISECHVPRCRDLREHIRRNQQQADSRRRAAVTEMMRQRAAEVAGGC
ncbi:Histone acetyltransferase [Heracleum sosnowskyi]|uniref:histone acetyltransferase n=1 Tax=Heracleum sosnowskyi TaxID=360622 RepID=A0AAD8GW43_9APIA|nr:Histone acetyltransferase [Heracleum sosnowskyi]